MRKKYIQHPETLELVPADEYVRPKQKQTHHIMPDIKPFVSVCGDMTGKEISSRRQLREFEKRNGLVQIGNDKSVPGAEDRKTAARKHRESVLRDLHRVRSEM